MVVAKKAAVIDLGTNTFNLIIASKQENGFEIHYGEKIGVALGMGGIIENRISDEAFKRGIDALLTFKKKCDEFQVKNIKAIGTSALRDAINSFEFCNEALQKTNIVIEIIDGLREADLIYKGVSWSYAFDESSVIMDIGGGSTEFIFANQQGIHVKKSFNIGVSRIYQAFSFHDPLTETDIAAIEDWLDVTTESFFDTQQCNVLVGASGSFETFYEMIHFAHFTEKFAALEFPINDLNSTLDWIIGSTLEERDKHPFIIPIRRKMAAIAAVKTRWVMRKLGVEKTFVTPCSLKEGVLYEMFHEKN